MLIDQSRVIVEDSLCASCSVHTKQVHHRDFPEIRAEGGSVLEGANYLVGLLARARESVGSAWHRETIDLAITDLEGFLKVLAEDESRKNVSCQCGGRVLDQSAVAVSGAARTQKRTP